MMMMLALLLAISASAGPCAPVAHVADAPSDGSKTILIRFAPAQNEIVAISRVGRGDATVELTITDEGSHRNHVRVGTRQAEIDGEIGQTIGRLGEKDCRAGGIVTTLRKLVRREIDRKTAENALRAVLAQPAVIGPSPNATP